MATDFQPFNLGAVLQTAEAIKATRAQATTDRLREAYLGEQIQGMRADRERQANIDQLTFGKQRAAQEHTRAGYILESANPKNLVESQFPDIQQAIVKAGGDWATITDDQLKETARQIRARAGAEAGIDSGALSERQQFEMRGQLEDKRIERQQGFQREMQEDQQRFTASQNDLARRSAQNGTSSQLITRPVGNGLVQDFAWNPKTNTREPAGEPYRPVTTHQGNVTEGERKAAALGTRLDAALTSLNAISEAAPDAVKPGLVERGLEGVGMETAANAVRSSERQQADAAQLDALDAALTLATGAAYTKEQLQNLRKAYFPQIGDSDETVAAKQARFETIVKTARIAAGRAEPSIDKANRGASGSWATGEPVQMNGFTVRRIK
jgi:hypothetical protein